MDSVADRSTGQPAAAGVVGATVKAVDDSLAWVVDIATGRVVRRPISTSEPAAGRPAVLN